MKRKRTTTLERTILRPGKYVVSRFIPTYNASWKETKQGMIPPQTIEGHWTTTTIHSTEPITIERILP